MKTAMMFDWIDQTECLVDLEAHTGLTIGERCKRTADNIQNCLTIGSSDAMAMRADNEQKWAKGVVRDLHYHGENAWGGHVITAEVRFDNGETIDVGVSLLQSEK